jgi:hypothetical protein
MLRNFIERTQGEADSMDYVDLDIESIDSISNYLDNIWFSMDLQVIGYFLKAVRGIMNRDSEAFPKARLLYDRLSSRALEILKIDISKLHSPEEWEIVGLDGRDLSDEEGYSSENHIELIRTHFDENSGRSFMKFFVKRSGIRIYIKSFGRSLFSFAEQERLLNEVLSDVSNVFGWEPIVDYIDGGDISAIYEGTLDEDIRIYSIMDENEARFIVNGGIIYPGMIFVANRDEAYRVREERFGKDSDKKVYNFSCLRRNLRGLNYPYLMNSMLLRRVKGRLVPVVEE